MVERLNDVQEGFRKGKQWYEEPENVELLEEYGIEQGEDGKWEAILVLKDEDEIAY